MDVVFEVVVGRARSTLFDVERVTVAGEDDEAVNDCTGPQLSSRRREDFNRFMLA